MSTKLNMDLFDYLSYREFLNDYYQKRKEKEKGFTFRYISDVTGVDPSLFVKVIQKKRHLTEKVIPSIAELCGFDENAKSFFHYLMLFEKAKTPDQIRVAFEKLLAFKEKHAEVISTYQYEFFNRWYYAAVRTVLDFYNCKDDYRGLGLALTPTITAHEAEQAITLLSSLEMIEKDNGGYWRPNATVITTGDKWSSAAIQSYQVETMRQAQLSLLNHTPESRDISTVAVSINRNKLPEFKAMISEFRKQIMHYVANQQDEDIAYQLNIQFFPMSK